MLVSYFYLLKSYMLKRKQSIHAIRPMLGTCKQNINVCMLAHRARGWESTFHRLLWLIVLWMCSSLVIICLNVGRLAGFSCQHSSINLKGESATLMRWSGQNFSITNWIKACAKRCMHLSKMTRHHNKVKHKQLPTDLLYSRLRLEITKRSKYGKSSTSNKAKAMKSPF